MSTSSAHGAPVAQPLPQIRDARLDDMADVHRIFAHHVRHGLGSFNYDPPSLADMEAKREEVLAMGLPFLVADENGQVLGYTYAGSYRPRPGYDYTVENSVYVAPGLAGRGIGRALLGALLIQLEAGPWRQVVAIVGDSGNLGSITLHERLGFQRVGTLRSVGFKHGRWVDTVILQRPLGLGDAQRPALPDNPHPLSLHPPDAGDR